MSDQFSGIRDLLAMRDNRRQRGMDRISGSLRNLGNNLFASREAEKDRTARAEQAKLDREYLDTPFAEGPREYYDPTTNQTYTAQTPREWDALQRSLDIAARAQEGEAERGFRADQAGLDREHDFAMLDETVDANISQLERQLGIERGVYDGGSYVDPQSGKRYQWNTPEQFQMALRSIDSDRMADRIALEASLRDSGSQNTADDVFSAYLAARDEVSGHPTLYNQETRTWLPLTDMDREDAMRYARNALVAQGLDEAGVELALEMFGDYYDAFGKEATEPEEQRPTPPRTPGYTINTPEYRPGTGPLGAFRESTPQERGTTFNIESQIGMPVGTITGAGQENVTSEEKGVYDRLLEMFNATYGPEFDPRVQEYLDELNARGTSGDLTRIEQFLQRAGF